jgi:hypothetical protein
MLAFRLFARAPRPAATYLLTALLIAPGASAATVTVRVEGLNETKLASTAVSTTAAPVVKDGDGEHACSGTSALAALQLATGGHWGGPWNDEYNQYEIFSIEGESHIFEPEAATNYFWSFWLNDKEAEVGACEAQLQPGDRVLFFPACFGVCPPARLPLEISLAPSANVGESVTVAVEKYTSAGEGSPAAGVTVTGATAVAATDPAGHATLTFPSPGTFLVRAEAPGTVRSEQAICVHRGDDGTCATPLPPPSGPPASGVGGARTSVPPTPARWPIVARLLGLLQGHVYARRAAPRELRGSISLSGVLRDVRLRLTRTRRNAHGRRRCSFYNARRERFRAMRRCGAVHGRYFSVGARARFSYLLPFRLPRGRYVLDVKASDTAGHRSRLARDTSRFVFYVR